MRIHASKLISEWSRPIPS